jgi:threonine aldolase
LEDIWAIAHTCKERNLKLHLDGARFWNACIATGISEAEYAAPFDTVSVCFSKGLGAPVGSALVGTEEMMQRARRFRKMFGGAMRQAGIIAAGALYAVQHHRDRLVDDHENAKRLAIALQPIDGIDIIPDEVQTNILYFNTPGVPATALSNTLAELGIGMLTTGAHRLRAVTNLMVSREQIDEVPPLVEKALHLARMA